MLLSHDLKIVWHYSMLIEKNWQWIFNQEVSKVNNKIVDIIKTSPNTLNLRINPFIYFNWVDVKFTPNITKSEQNFIIWQPNLFD